MSDSLYTAVSSVTGFQQLVNTPVHVGTDYVAISGTIISEDTPRWNRTALSVESNVVPVTGSWNSTNTTLVANSSQWAEAKADIAEVAAASANWTTGYNNSLLSRADLAGVAAVSADWNYAAANSGSGGSSFNSSELAASSADWNYTAANTAISVAFDVTNSGSGAYRFNNGGLTNDDNPSLHLQRGKTYRFRVDASGHPFLIKTQAGTGTSNQYLSGVTGAGTVVGNVDFEIRHDAPRQLFYQCQYHSGMVGAIHIGDATATTAVFESSGSWNSTNTTLVANSSQWAEAKADIAEVAAVSANWTSGYNASILSRADLAGVASVSANWTTGYNNSLLSRADLAGVAGASGNWNSTYNQVQDSTTDLNVDSGTLVVDKSVNRVGIGTATPNETLTVVGNISAGGDTNSFIVSGGSVGVGVLSPYGPLHVKSVSGFNFMVNSANSGFVSLNAINNNNTVNVPMEFRASKICFTNGDVGIGTTAPQTTTQFGDPAGSVGLTVAGSVSSKDNVRVGGKVGIGVAPTGPLQVKQSSGINLMVNTATSGFISLNAINDDNSANVPMEFRSSKTCFTNGALTIGTTAIGPGHVLTVAGAISSQGLRVGYYSLPIADGSNGEQLTTDGSGNVTWEAAGGGGSGEANENSFKTFALSANRAAAAIGADVVADTDTDTITLCAGPNIALLSDPTNDVITISGSPGGGGSSFNSSEIAAASARYTRTALSLETNVAPATGSWNSTNTTTVANSANWNYTATNSAAHANESSFKTIALSGNRGAAAIGADVVADTATDTFTLCAGPNIVLISDPTNDVITISGSAGGGGGGSGEDNENSFKTVTLSANRLAAAIGADVVADSTTDTLTLCAGPNIVLISDPTNDVITISGSAGGGGGGSSFNSSEIAAASARYTRTALSLETNVVPATGSWNSTNTTLVANSSQWAEAKADIAEVAAVSANWTSGYNASVLSRADLAGVASVSGRWNRTALSLETNVVPSTGSWNSTTTTVNVNSADWSYVAANSGSDLPGRLSVDSEAIYTTVSTDASYFDVMALLHFEDANAATSTSDDSFSRRAVSFAGTAQISTAQKKFGTASLLLDGNSDYVSLANSADLDLGTSPFTIECWFYYNAATAPEYATIFDRGDGSGGGTSPFWMAIKDDSGTYYLVGAADAAGGSGNDILENYAAATISDNTWYHLAFVRDGNNFYTYLNGTVAWALTGSTSSAMADNNEPLYIGARGQSGTGAYWGGYIDEFRLTVGTCRYAGGITFTPSTDGLPGETRFNQTVITGISASTGMTSFQLEDDDGTEVAVSDAKEVKFIGSGITTNWTDTSTGSDGDPYDLTFTVDQNSE